MEYGSKMLTVAVMAILVTAPLGAVAIMLAGPRLLTREEPPEEGGQPPGGLVRFRETQSHGSQQLVAARRFSCL